jgi:hypothetical protein
MISFLGLPPEVHVRLVRHLKYPDLIRLQQTCRYFKDLPSQEDVRQSLLNLENDFISANCSIKQQRIHNTESSVWSSQVPVRTLPREMMELGYRGIEAAKLQGCAPCYTCHLILRAENFETEPNGEESYANTLGGWEHEIFFSQQKIEPAPEPTITRRCLECGIKAGRPNEDLRIVTSSSQHFVLCKSCENVQQLDSTVGVRQLIAAFCDSCWYSEGQRWRETKEELELAHSAIGSYLQWMQEFECGTGRGGERYWQGDDFGKEPLLWDLPEIPEEKYRRLYGRQQGSEEVDEDES